MIFGKKTQKVREAAAPFGSSTGRSSNHGGGLEPYHRSRESGREQPFQYHPPVRNIPARPSRDRPAGQWAPAPQPRTPSREGVRTPSREGARLPSRDGARLPSREGARLPSRDGARGPSREGARGSSRGGQRGSSRGGAGAGRLLAAGSLKGLERRGTLLHRADEPPPVRQPVRCKLLTPNPIVAVVGMPMELLVTITNDDLSVIRHPDIEDFNLYVRSGPAKSRDYRLIVQQLSERDFKLVWGTSVSGKYSLAITCQHLGIQGSPLEIDCQYPVSVPDVSYIANLKNLRAGVGSTFLIISCDQAGNRRTRGGEDFAVRVRGPSALQRCILEDKEDGRYSNFVLGTKAGQYEMHVTLDGEHLQNSPAAFRINPAEASAPHSTVVCIKSAAHRDLAIRDGYFVASFEADIYSSEDEDFRVLPSRVKLTGTDKQKHLHQLAGEDVSAVPARQAERHRLRAAGQAPVHAEGSAWPKKELRSSVLGPSPEELAKRKDARKKKEKATAWADPEPASPGGSDAGEGSASPFARMQRSKKRAAERASRSEDTPQKGRREGKGRKGRGEAGRSDGERTEGEGRPKTPGGRPAVAQASRGATARQKRHEELKKKREEEARRYSKHCVLPDAPGVTMEPRGVWGQCGRPLVFQLRARDRFGNALISGGDRVAATATSLGKVRGAHLTEALSVTDNQDGTWDLTMLPRVATGYSFSVAVNGRPLEQLTLRGRVVAGSSDPRTSFVVGRNCIPRRFTAGSRVAALIVARDRFKNPRERGGEGFSIRVDLVEEAEEVNALEQPIDGFENVTRALATRLTKERYEGILRSAVQVYGEAEREPPLGGPGSRTAKRRRFASMARKVGALLQTSSSESDWSSDSELDAESAEGAGPSGRGGAPGPGHRGRRVTIRPGQGGPGRDASRPLTPESELAAEESGRLGGGRGARSRIDLHEAMTRLQESSSSVAGGKKKKKKKRLSFSVSLKPEHNRAQARQLSKQRQATWAEKMFGMGAQPGYELCVGCEIEVNNSRDGVALDDGPDHLMARKAAEVLAGITTQVTDLHNGLYMGHVRIVKSGSYMSSVLLNGAPVKNGRASFEVVPGECEPSKCKAIGGGIRRAEAGFSSAFWVSVHDKFGNLLPESTPEIKCSLTGPEQIDAVVIPHNHGIYRVSYWARQPGEYLISVTCNDVLVLGTPKKLVVATQRQHKSSSLGDGFRTATAGHPATFRMHAIDSTGMRKLVGGDVFRVSLELLPGTSTSVRPLLHRMRAQLVTAERNRQYVIQAGGHGEGEGRGAGEEEGPEREAPSPTPSEAKAARARDVLTTLFGKKHGVAHSAEEVQLLEEEEAMKKEVEDRSHILASTTDVGDGSYVVTYVPGVAGQYRIKIEMLMAEEEVKEEERERQQDRLDEMITYMSPWGRRRESRRARGSDSDSSDEPSAEEDAGGLERPYAAAGDGGYQWVDVTPLYVKTTNAPVVTVTHAEPSGPACLLLGRNALDRSTDQLMPDANARGLEFGSGVPGRLPDWKSLLKQCGFGEVQKIDETKEEQLKMERLAYLPPHLQGTTRSMEDEVLLEIEAGTMGTLTLFVCDRFLNMATTGSGELRCDTVLLEDPRGAPAALRPVGPDNPTEGLEAGIRHSPKGDGTFAVHLRAHQAGLYSVRVWVAGSQWRNLACKVRVTPGLLRPSKCHVFGPGLHSAQAGEVAKFTIEARDSFGNQCLGAGDVFSVTLVPDSDNVSIKAAKAAVRDVGGGLYEAAYKCAKTGPFGIVVNYLGDRKHNIAPQAIAAAQITVEAGRATGSSCLARGPGLLKAAAGVPAVVAVLIQDELGNPKSVDNPHRAASTVGAQGLHAYLHARDDPSVAGHTTVTQASIRKELPDGGGESVEKYLPGFYNVIYRAPRPGAFVLGITLDGEHIQGSPYEVPVARLDVGLEDRDLSAELGFSSELVYSWGRDPSGTVLRELADDVYGFEVLVEQMEREMARAQRERAARSRSRIVGAMVGDKKAKVLQLGGFQINLDEVIEEEGSPRAEAVAPLGTGGVRLGGRGGAAGGGPAARTSHGGGGEGGGLLRALREARKSGDGAGAPASRRTSAGGGRRHSRSLRPTAATKMSAWQRAGGKAMAVQRELKQVQISQEVSRIMLKPKTLTRQEQMDRVDKALADETRRHLAVMAVHMRRAGESIAETGARRGRGDERSRAKYEEAVRELEKRERRVVLEEPATAQMLPWTNPAQHFRGDSMGLTKEQHTMLGYSRAAGLQIAGQRRARERLAEALRRADHYGPEDGRPDEWSDDLIPPSLRDKYRIKLRPAQALRGRREPSDSDDEDGADGAGPSRGAGPLSGGAGSDAGSDSGGGSDDEEGNPLAGLGITHTARLSMGGGVAHELMSRLGMDTARYYARAVVPRLQGHDVPVPEHLPDEEPALRPRWSDDEERTPREERRRVQDALWRGLGAIPAPELDPAANARSALLPQLDRIEGKGPKSAVARTRTVGKAG